MSLLVLKDGVEGAPKDHLLSMREAIDSLHDMESSFFHAMNYLITQVAICVPSRQPTTFAILEPLCDAAVAFLHPLVKSWTFMSTILDYCSCVLADQPVGEGMLLLNGEFYDSMRLNAQRVRDTFPLLDATLVTTEALLIAELRGPYGLESLLCILKRLPWSSSMRVDLLDDLPQLISTLHSYCQGAMRYFNIAEGLVIRLHDFCNNKVLVEALERHGEVGRSLHDLSQFASDSTMHSSSHALDLGHRGRRLWVRQDYMGREYLRRDIILRFTYNL
ncbi:hypothetical protein F5146DRAFT_1137094 [Armillaria mellea]|nr:hypothetical protein F5146DRAFT_1137094 [Armillaria mellea]